MHPSFFIPARMSGLAAVDHSLATELVMGVLRWRSLLDSKIAESLRATAFQT